jgi:hypothetical protein
MIALTKDDTCAFDLPVGRAVAVSAHPPILTRALGAAPHVELSVCSFRVSSDDAIVLASKRLAGFEDRRALSAWLLQGQQPQELLERTIAVIPISREEIAPETDRLGVRLHLAQIAAGIAFAIGLLLIS